MKKGQSDPISFILLLLLFLSCNPDANNTGFTIQASIHGLDDGPIQLAKIDLQSNEKVVVDSTESLNGFFTFNGKVTDPYLHTILINDTMMKIHLFLENQEISVTGDFLKPDEIQVSGSREDSLFKAYGMDAIFDESIGMEIIENHPDYVFAAFTAFYYFQFYNLPRNTMNSIVQSFSGSVKTSTYYKHLYKLYSVIEKVAIGQLAPDFKLPNTDEKLIGVSDFKGQYVLLDFWASWCAPCRAANPSLVKVSNKYSSESFSIVSISVDKDRGKWLSAIEKDGLNWTNVSALKGWDDVSLSYGVKSIPQNFLLDPSGVIIDKNIKMEELEGKLESIFEDRQSEK